MQILDCTLRDGGYVNDWHFGEKVIRKILKKLSSAQIDIVECGFLSETEYCSDKTIFSRISQISDLLPPDSECHYVAMVALGEKEISYEKIDRREDTSISGIRLSFHKHEVERAFDYARNLMEKGYQVFIQPVGTCTYTDRELLELVEKVNQLKPYAFYIVDTLGTITGTELMRLFQLVDNNLDTAIKLGFHSHNNLQLSFANAQKLIRLFTKRDIIIDASVLGMGRGAGNLCTELITQYMNENLDTSYNVTSLLEIVDNYLMKIKQKHPWGYTIPYYIAAVHKCHPNYATYLMNLQTVPVKDIEKMIVRIPQEKRGIYDKACIARIYQEYQAHDIDDSEAVHKLTQIWKENAILIVAPGKTLITEQARIQDYIDKNNPYIILLNFTSSLYKNDMVFISNLKRFENLDFIYSTEYQKEIVITSNISAKSRDNIYKINYADYLNKDSLISDNAGLILLRLLRKCGVKTVALAGFDGFVANAEENYFDKELINNVEKEILELKTEKIGKQLECLKKDMNMVFITTTQYEKE